MKLPVYLHYTLIGLLLSDGGLERSVSSGNVRLSVNMSFKNLPYLFHLYNLFEPYTNTDVKILDVKSGKNNKYPKNYSTSRFKTISMPQLLYYYNIFYKYNHISGSIKKIISSELKFNFNGISLAHLIMGDGNYSFDKKIVRIYTNSFAENEVLLLSEIIKANLGINNKVKHDRRNQFIIIIEKDDIPILRSAVLPYMHPSMVYKLGIKESLIHKFNYERILDLI